MALSFEPSADMVTPDLPVCHAAGRDVRLSLALWDIVKALIQGRAVVLHCEHSFHRGPCGLMATLKRLLDIDVASTKRMILQKRDVWEGYAGPMRAHRESLVRAYHWACNLPIWAPPILRRAPARWGQASASSHTGVALPAVEGKYL